MTITTLSGPEGSGGLAERGHDRALCPVVAERIRRELHEAEMRKAVILERFRRQMMTRSVKLPLRMDVAGGAF